MISRKKSDGSSKNPSECRGQSVKPFETKYTFHRKVDFSFVGRKKFNMELKVAADIFVSFVPGEITCIPGETCIFCFQISSAESILPKFFRKGYQIFSFHLFYNFFCSSKWWLSASFAVRAIFFTWWQIFIQSK